MHSNTTLTISEKDYIVIHANCICLGENQSVLILGESGTGKSALSLELIAAGACLVADDQTKISKCSARNMLHAEPPDSIKGLLEIYGVGLVSMPYKEKVPIKLVCILENKVAKRMPNMHTIIKYFDTAVPLLHLTAHSYLNKSIIEIVMRDDVKRVNVL